VEGDILAREVTTQFEEVVVCSVVVGEGPVHSMEDTREEEEEMLPSSIGDLRHVGVTMHRVRRPRYVDDRFHPCCEGADLDSSQGAPPVGHDDVPVLANVLAIVLVRGIREVTCGARRLV